MSDKFPSFKIGDSAAQSKTVTEKDIEQFAALIGDYNPIHMDEKFAKKTRFKGRIAHGVLAVGLISSVLGNQLPGPGTIYLSQTVKFLRPVRPGDTIKARATILEIESSKRMITLKTDCFNQREECILEGEARVLYDNIMG
ncbi:MAG TPA: MaoC family dehydratase [Candidatus Thermoplasmatota archaeon]|nr:MaoC family dehydratase [Candidatus Thermoplasmatota archaeon]